MSMQLKLVFRVASALTSALTLQAMSALRQQKGAAEVATNHWKEQCEAGQAREGLASASRAKLEGQLKANSTEVDQLCLSSNQQAQVSSRSHSCYTKVGSSVQAAMLLPHKLNFLEGFLEGLSVAAGHYSTSSLASGLAPPTSAVLY